MVGSGRPQTSPVCPQCNSDQTACELSPIVRVARFMLYYLRIGTTRCRPYCFLPRKSAAHPVCVLWQLMGTRSIQRVHSRGIGMRARLHSVAALCGALASTLLLCAPSYSQPASGPAFMADERADSSLIYQANESRAGFSAFAPAVGAALRPASSLPSAPEPAAGGGHDDWEVAPAGARPLQCFPIFLMRA